MKMVNVFNRLLVTILFLSFVTVADALNVGTQVHTSPAMFGKVMSLIEPRMAVAYHFFNDFDTAPITRG